MTTETTKNEVKEWLKGVMTLGGNLYARGAMSEAEQEDMPQFHHKGEVVSFQEGIETYETYAKVHGLHSSPRNFIASAYPHIDLDKLRKDERNLEAEIHKGEGQIDVVAANGAHLRSALVKLISGQKLTEQEFDRLSFSDPKDTPSAIAEIDSGLKTNPHTTPWDGYIAALLHKPKLLDHKSAIDAQEFNRLVTEVAANLSQEREAGTYVPKQWVVNPSIDVGACPAY